VSPVTAEPVAADAPDHSSPPRGHVADWALTPRTLALIGLVTALLAFGVGFGLAVVDTGPSERDEAAGPVAAPTSEAPATTAPTSSTTSSTVAIAPAPTIQPPTTQTTLPATTEPVTSTSVTSPPTTGTPALMQVQHGRDAQGRLVLTAGGAANITFTNSGGTVGQWFIQSGGYVYVVGPTSGVLNPGQSKTVSIRAVPEIPSQGVNGTLNMIVSGQGPISVPLRINA
jgi:hypothetical protein